jgi:hypothetical protein
VVCADRDPGAVVGQGVDAVGVRAAQLGDDEVVGADPVGIALRAQLAAGVLEVSDELLLPGVDADYRLAGRQLRLDALVQVAELRVAVGMVGALAGLDGL